MSAAGTAKVLVLLSDGSGPLYAQGSAPMLGEAIREAIRALDRPLLQPIATTGAG